MAPTIVPGAQATPIPASMLARVLGGALPMMQGGPPLNPADPAKSETFGGWFGPMDPPSPGAPPDVRGRAFDYDSGVNVALKPRAYEPIDFPTLRRLADGFDILRLAIETRKDQVARLGWSILPKKLPGSAARPKSTPVCTDIEKFFARPDGKNDWNTWLRLLLEDLFVIDAPTIYARRRVDGGIFGFEVVDGGTVKVVVDQYGRTPDPPLPAYQQILKGIPANNYTTDEMVYMPRNKRPHKMYGFSPVEQLVITINVAIRREVSRLQFYTEGNIPEAMISVPPEWSVTQIQEFQKYWDSILEGNTAQRRHAKFVPGGMNLSWTKGSPDGLKDDFDEWIARVICFAFSLPPTAFIRQMNRATADTSKEAALEEGLAPLMVWIKGLMDYLVIKYFNQNDIEFVWDEISDIDPHVENQINTSYVQLGIKSIDEVRAELGLEPLGIGNAIWGVGPQGILFLSDLKDPSAREAFKPQAAPPPGAAPSSDDPLSGMPYEVMSAAGIPTPKAAKPGAGNMMRFGGSASASGVGDGGEDGAANQNATGGNPMAKPIGLKNPAFRDPVAAKHVLGKRANSLAHRLVTLAKRDMTRPLIDQI